MRRYAQAWLARSSSGMSGTVATAQPDRQPSSGRKDPPYGPSYGAPSGHPTGRHSHRSAAAAERHTTATSNSQLPPPAADIGLSTSTFRDQQGVDRPTSPSKRSPTATRRDPMETSVSAPCLRASGVAVLPGQ